MITDHDRRWLLPLLWFGLGLAAGLIIAIPVYAADDDYCLLWSREQTRIELASAADIDTATASQERILELRAKNFLWCKGTDVRPQLEDDNGDQAWANSVYEVIIARAAAHIAAQGTVPASDNPGKEEWSDACAAAYRTWNPDDGTVVRRNSPERVKCPLVFRDGAWVVE